MGRILRRAIRKVEGRSSRAASIQIEIHRSVLYSGDRTGHHRCEGHSVFYERWVSARFDILRSLKGEDSYGVAVSASHGPFGGFLLHREALLRFSPLASHRARPALGRLDKGSLER